MAAICAPPRFFVENLISVFKRRTIDVRSSKNRDDSNEENGQITANYEYSSDILIYSEHDFPRSRVRAFLRISKERD